ncbi:MAG TPA: hypothetical protein VFJ90_04940 [Candidatus Didemnitutus sp.]|nr:hypothetical protein [Candidatus Didemnitutus sp.]
MQLQDPFTGQITHLQGARLPGAEGWTAVLDGHRQRLRALDQLGEKAAQCAIETDKDRTLVLAEEDEVGLLEMTGGEWAALGQAIRDFRATLPLVRLEDFGFSAEVDDPFEANTAQLSRIGGGVEALAFVDAHQSVYKFFLFREGGDVGATFAFTRGEGEVLQATAVPGSYRMLFEKLRLIHELGIPTELIGITPEGIPVAKQTLGRALPEKTDVSGLDPERLIPIPSRFLRADRDHPRLAFLDDEPWLVADTHDRNVVVAEDGSRRIIDLVAAPLPGEWLNRLPLFRDWIARARLDPRAEVLAPVNDDEL